LALSPGVARLATGRPLVLNIANVGLALSTVQRREEEDVKTQTLIITVGDDMADPAELVEKALERMLFVGPVRPQYGDDPEVEFAAREWPYMIQVDDAL
jgi:hypothetical protein